MKNLIVNIYRSIIPAFIRDIIYLVRNSEEWYYRKVLKNARIVIRKAIIKSSKRKDIRNPIFEIGAGGTYNKEIFLKSFVEYQYWTSNIDCLHIDDKIDIICDARWLPLKDSSVGTIVCSEVLEHIAETMVVVSEMHRILVDGGLGIITTPFYFPIHEFPKDYYRFTPDGLKHILRNFSEVECSYIDGLKPSNILTIIKK